MNRRIEDPATETVSLLDAARRFGIGKSMAYDLAKRGKDLTEGVRILKFGSDARPVYRVSKAQIDSVLRPASCSAQPPRASEQESPRHGSAAVSGGSPSPIADDPEIAPRGRAAQPTTA